ncbi:DUF6116 family protein [Thermoproteota archaeon]
MAKLKKIKAFCKRFKIVFLVIFIIDLIWLDPLPFFDEIVLGLAAVYGWV